MFSDTPSSRVYFFVGYVLVIVILSACINGATKAYKKGMQKLQQGEYNSSIEYFKISMAKGGNKARLSYLIAENYRLTNRISEAKKYYQSALATGVREDKALYYYAQSLKANGNYFDAKLMFEKYTKIGANKNLVAQAQKEVDFLQKINELRNREVSYKITNMGEDINTEGPEYAPVLHNGELIYTASNNQFKYTAIGTGFTDIYTFKFDGTGEFTGIRRSFGDKINKNRTHEACATLAPDGSMVIFVRSNDGKRKGTVETDIYITELRDENWTEPVILTPVSDPRSWESTPMLSPDGKILYFASNKKGGFGGIDLYKSIWSDSAGWSAPINLGPDVNTAGNEMFPYVARDNTFYFASDGQPGLGRLDLFVLKQDSSGRFYAENLGPGINSPADDFGICFKTDSVGYFSSNREGGKGDDDLYTFRKLPPAPKPIRKTIKNFLTIWVTAHEYTQSDTSKVPISNAIIELRNEASIPLDSLIANEDGMATFAVDSTYRGYIYAQKKGYFANTIAYVLNENSFRTDSISPELYHRYYTGKLSLQKILRGKEIVLEHIYYDYNKADIRPDAEPDLMLVVDFMKKNPNVYIELGAHTDARGNDEYNLKLSKLRAQSAVNFIVQQGIEPARIKPVGYGETRHIIPNAQTEEEHQINRRTEFKIIDIKN